MGVTTYTPTGISHTTSVDFSKRAISQPVHIVQYDRSLPILAVSLYNNGQLYRLPESTRVNIRFGKPDKSFVYNPALGCNSNRTIAYFEITQQMTLFDGEFYPVIELIDGEWYYFDYQGYMVTGWLYLTSTNCDYYFYSNGVMARNCELWGTHKFDSNGHASRI